jgi:beta-xylosidase
MFPDLSVNDGHVFADLGTNDIYCYCVDEHRSPSRIVGAKLKPDMVTLQTSVTTVLTPSMPWEDFWNEAPFVIKHGSNYYMMYSGSAWWEPEYSVGYAKGPTPLGPFVKFPGNPILRHVGSIDGPGHNAVTMSPDGKEMFIVYHTHAGHWTTERVLAIDRLKFIKNGKGEDILTVPGGATDTDQPLPSGARPRPRALSDTFDGTGAAPWYILQESKPDWNLSSGSLHIKMAQGDFWRSHGGGKNVFLQDVPNGNFAISTHVRFDRKSDGAQASLIVWRDADNFVMFGPGDVDGNKYVVANEDDQKNDTSLCAAGPEWPGGFRVECRGRTFSFFTQKPGGGWTRLKKTIKVRFKPQYVGLGAWSTSDDESATASFDSFDVVPLP